MCSQDYLSLYLQVQQYANSISEGWSREVKFRFTVHNQFDDKTSITKGVVTSFFFSVSFPSLYVDFLATFVS